jgi:hypothetical protein
MSRSQENREYYLKNKEKWVSYGKKIHCEVCDKDIRKDFYKKHITTAIHKRHENNDNAKMDKLKESLKNEILQELKLKL